MGSKKKNIGNIIFLFLVFGFTIWNIFKGQDLYEIGQYIQTAQLGYLLLGIICVVLFIFGESLVIFYMMRSLNEKVKLGRCYLYSFIGFFFSCITPSASGGQPAQIYYMNKDKISIPIATLVLMIVTITYKFVLVVVGVAVLIFQPAKVIAFLNPSIGWFYLGVALNIIGVTAMFTLAFHPKMAKTIMITGLKILEKIKIIRKKESRLEKLKGSMDRYHQTAEYFWTHKIVIINVFLITVAQRFILFFVTYFTYKAFGLHGINVMDIVLCQAMISVAADMLPLPGGMGISEKLFLSVFLPIFGAKFTLPAMILSRGISYYSQLVISGAMTIYANMVIGAKSDMSNDRIKGKR